jgi:hypothetical protein
MIRKILTILALFLPIFSTAQGWLLGANIGYAYIGNKTGRTPNDNLSYDLQLTGGYKFVNYFAWDLSVAAIPKGISINNAYDPYVSSYKVLIDTAAKFYIPISDFVDISIHLGPGYLISQSKQNNAGVFMGLGANFKVTTPLSIIVEDYGILAINNIQTDVNVLAVGITYEF